MSVRLIVDSTADLRPEIRQQVTVIPMTIQFGQEEFQDGVTITHQEFYEKLIECDILPTTSQIPPFVFEEVFRQTVEAGDDVVAITISSKLSGTCQSARVAAAEFPGRVFVVDALTVAIGTGILTELALGLVKQGLAAGAIAQKLECEREKICLLAMVDTLEYLRKGGRLSAAAAIAGSLLSIKPVINLDGGAINILGKARGSKQGGNMLVREIEKVGGVDFNRPVLLGYTGLSDMVLKKYIADSAALWDEHLNELRYVTVGSTVGTHAGPGAIAVAFFKK